MTEKLLNVRLTYEELRLLSDNFCMSFMHDGVDPDTEKLERIADKLSDVMERERKKT